jgi:hypothetical protein
VQPQNRLRTARIVSELCKPSPNCASPPAERHTHNVPAAQSAFPNPSQNFAKPSQDCAKPPTHMEHGQLQLEVAKVSRTVSQALATRLAHRSLAADALQPIPNNNSSSSHTAARAGWCLCMGGQGTHHTNSAFCSQLFAVHVAQRALQRVVKQRCQSESCRMLSSHSTICSAVVWVRLCLLTRSTVPQTLLCEGSIPHCSLWPPCRYSSLHPTAAPC